MYLNARGPELQLRALEFGHFDVKYQHTEQGF